MKEMQQDLKALQDSNNEMDVKSDMGYKYKDMYTDDYLEFLQKLCNKYDIDFNQEEIDWEWCNYIHNKQWELENKIKQSINANMTADEKFDIICRILDINQKEMIQSIISEIKNLYDYAQDKYMNESVLFLDEIESETYNSVKMSHLEEYNDGRIGDFDAMDFDCEYLDLDKDTMNFVRLALQCGLKEIQY